MEHPSRNPPNVNSNPQLNSANSQSQSISKLLNNLIPSLDSRYSDNYTSYFLRLLNSRLNISTNNESNIMTMILDRVSKGPNNLNNVERLQTLYSSLVNKKTLKRRWAILYLLHRVSADSDLFPGDSSKILQSIFMNEESLSIRNNMQTYLGQASDEEEDYPEEIKKANSPVVVVNTNKTNKIITEKDLINDLIFVFQGIDGNYINYNSIANGYCLNPLIPFHDSVHDIVSTLAELGWLYRKVNNHLKFFNEANLPSQFIQSFSYAIQSELSEYYKLISLFKKMNSVEGEGANDGTNVEELTLKKLLLWTFEPLEKMKWLAICCEAVYTLRGIPILSQIYSYVFYSGADKILDKLLEESSKPLFVFIKNWTFYGELQDPYKEFFVDINEKVAEDEIWASRYILVTKNIPIFFNKSFSQKIFEIGKCVNFIRKFCDDANYSLGKLKSKFREEVEKLNNEERSKMQVDLEHDINSENPNKIKISTYTNSINLLINLEDDAKLNLSLLPQLLTEVDSIYKEINKELINIIYKKFKFFENLKSINRYLLLGQGDMMQYLMDLLFNELKKPAIQIYKHNLLNILETAIRASNAQYHDADCLKRLNIKLMDSSAGDVGWDIFVLEYIVDSPLNVIFTKHFLTEYQKLFFFFWKLKRLEFSQDHQIWRNFMTYSHSLKNRFDHLRPYIQKSMLFNRQIIHFVTTLHNYIALEVLETEYKKLVEKLPNISKLDELVALHKKFVESVIEESLLNPESSLLYKKILQIFDLIFRFKTAQDVLITTLFEEYYRSMNSFSHSGREYNDDQSEIKFSKEAYNQISVLFEDFKNEITDLINNLELIGKGNLKYLAMKLDYNNYYSEREIENIHKKQRKHFDDYDDDENKEEEEEYEGEEVNADDQNPQNPQNYQNYESSQFESQEIKLNNKYAKSFQLNPDQQVDQDVLAGGGQVGTNYQNNEYNEEDVNTKLSGGRKFNMDDFMYARKDNQGERDIQTTGMIKDDSHERERYSHEDDDNSNVDGEI